MQKIIEGFVGSNIPRFEEFAIFVLCQALSHDYLWAKKQTEDFLTKGPQFRQVAIKVLERRAADHCKWAIGFCTRLATPAYNPPYVLQFFTTPLPINFTGYIPAHFNPPAQAGPNYHPHNAIYRATPPNEPYGQWLPPGER